MKYLNKSFSVYNNYVVVPKCDLCSQEKNYYVQTREGKFCTECYQKVKQQKAEERIKNIIKEYSR